MKVWLLCPNLKKVEMIAQSLEQRIGQPVYIVSQISPNEDQVLPAAWIASRYHGKGKDTTKGNMIEWEDIYEDGATVPFYLNIDEEFRSWREYCHFEDDTMKYLDSQRLPFCSINSNGKLIEEVVDAITTTLELLSPKESRELLAV